MKYGLYGQTLNSALRLPGPLVRHAHRADISLRPGGLRRFAGAHRRWPVTARSTWFLHRVLPDGSRYLRWTNLFEFRISADGRRIEYRRLDGAGRESFQTYLLGQVLSFSLLSLGIEPLHGTVIDNRGKAIAFLGSCGSGKSTLAAAFLSRGDPVITDDLVVLGARPGGFAVHPGTPRIKLFPAVARRILGMEAGAAYNSGTSKRVLPLGADQASARMVPLSAIYILDPPSPKRREIAIERLRPREGLLELICHTFNAMVVDRGRLARQFAFASELVSRVPIRKLSYPRNLGSLPGVRDAIIADVAL